jgi:hypothetical protein
MVHTKFEVAIVAFILGVALGGSIAAITLEKHCQNVLHKAEQLKDYK